MPVVTIARDRELALFGSIKTARDEMHASQQRVHIIAGEHFNADDPVLRDYHDRKLADARLAFHNKVREHLKSRKLRGREHAIHRDLPIIQSLIYTVDEIFRELGVESSLSDPSRDFKIGDEEGLIEDIERLVQEAIVKSKERWT